MLMGAGARRKSGCRARIGSSSMMHSPLVNRFRVDNPKRFHLAVHDPADMAGFEKDVAEKLALAHTRRMRDLQERLYAEHSWSLLVILQGVDAAGKDSAIKHL